MKKELAGLLLLALLGTIALVGIQSFREHTEESTYQPEDAKTEFLPAEPSEEKSVSYQSTLLDLLIAYPEGFEIHEGEIPGQEPSLTLMYWGPGQEKGFELHDGIRITITRGTHTAESVEKFAALRAQEAARVAPLADPLRDIRLGGAQWWKFSMAPVLGDDTYMFRGLPNNEYIGVSILVADERGIGYQKTTDNIIGSIIPQ